MFVLPKIDQRDMDAESLIQVRKWHNTVPFMKYDNTGKHKAYGKTWTKGDISLFAEVILITSFPSKNITYCSQPSNSAEWKQIAFCRCRKKSHAICAGHWKKDNLVYKNSRIIW